MRPVIVVAGALVTIVGAVWALQGAGVLLGSFMSSDPTWLWIGGGTVLLGSILAALGLRSHPSPKGE